MALQEYVSLAPKVMCKRGVARQEDRLEFLNKSGVAHFFAVFNGNMPTFVFSIGLISRAKPRKIEN